MYYEITRDEPSTSNFNTKIDYKIDSEGEEKAGVCRLCANLKDSVLNIYENKSLLFDISEKINKYLPIEVSQSDNLSHDICRPCLETVVSWDQFVQQCTDSDTKLRHQAENQIKLDNQVLETEHNDQSDTSVHYSGIQYVLTEYLKTLHIADNGSLLTLVCQNGACVAKPAMNVDTFIQHLQLEHSELETDEDIEAFLKNQVIFEEDIPEDDCDSDRVEVQEASNTDGFKTADIPCFFCPFCESAFSSRSRLVHHLNRYHIAVDMKAGVECCDATYRSRSPLLRHLQAEHVRRAPPAAAHWCRACGHVAPSADSLRQHVRLAHAHTERRTARALRAEAGGRDQKYIPAVCPECDHTFSNKYNMLVHMRSHRGGERHACDTCGNTYSTRGNLRQHAAAAHGLARRARTAHLCAHCGERFPTRAQRDAHALLHTGDRPHACRICGKAYRTRHTLTRHVEGHFDERRHPCDSCSRLFRKRSHLLVHVAAAHASRVRPARVTHDGAGRRRCVCGLCGARVAAAGWRRHARTHGAPRAACAACGRVFSDAGNLARHERAVHGARRAHACGACGARFSRAAHLAEHAATHAAARGFLCERCGAACRSAAALRSHAATHSPRHACACGALFSRRSSLAAHTRRATCAPHLPAPQAHPPASGPAPAAPPSPPPLTNPELPSSSLRRVRRLPPSELEGSSELDFPDEELADIDRDFFTYFS